ncbi:MAG: hypothetical protein ACRC75_02595, partial [Olsenella sp.]
IESGSIAPGYFDGSILAGFDSASFAYFESWEIEEIRLILSDPKYYATRRACEKSKGRSDTMRKYLRAGGPGYLGRVLGEKIARR